MATSPAIPITVISDVLCPWCWVGKRSIELAAKAAGVNVDLHWEPYLLDATLPGDGVDKLSHYTKKFGPRAQQMLVDPNNPLNAKGRPMGIEFKYHEGSKVFNSRPAHRLLYHARAAYGSDMQNKLQEIFFRRYHQEGQNLGLNDILLDACKEAGMPEAPTAAYIKSTQDDKEVTAAIQQSHSTNSEGVPYFVFPSGHAISGGQAVEVFARLLQKEAVQLAKK